MSRTPFIAGNWKMHKTIAEAEAYVAGLLPLRGIARLGGVAVGVVTTALRAPLAAMLVESLRRRTPGGEDPG